MDLDIENGEEGNFVFLFLLNLFFSSSSFFLLSSVGKTGLRARLVCRKGEPHHH